MISADILLPQKSMTHDILQKFCHLTAKSLQLACALYKSRMHENALHANTNYVFLLTYKVAGVGR